MATNSGPGGPLWAAMRKTPDTSTGDPAQMVSDLYGTTRRGKPDTRAAAADLGVSQRTVQRWIQRGLPRKSRSGGSEQLANRHQGWKASPEGRKASLSSRREARLRNKGTTIQFLGVITISGDRRRRSTSVPLNGDQTGLILDPLLAGDDAAAHRALEDAFGDRFGGSVSLSDIDSLDTFK